MPCIRVSKILQGVWHCLSSDNPNSVANLEVLLLEKYFQPVQNNSCREAEAGVEEVVAPLTAADLLRKSITLLASSGSKSMLAGLEAGEQLLSPFADPSFHPGNATSDMSSRSSAGSLRGQLW